MPGQLRQAEVEQLLAGRFEGAPLVDHDQLGAIEGDPHPIEGPVHVRQRGAHLFDRLADLARLEAPIDQLLGRLDAHQVLKRVVRLATPADRRPDETNLCPVAQLALRHPEDLGGAGEAVHGVVHRQKVASTSMSMKTLAAWARMATCVRTDLGVASATRAASRAASASTRAPASASLSSSAASRRAVPASQLSRSRSSSDGRSIVSMVDPK